LPFNSKDEESKGEIEEKQLGLEKLVSIGVDSGEKFSSYTQLGRERKVKYVPKFNSGGKLID
jgi:hypothetical protein